MLIDGKWVDAASGKHFESRNPATGELLATVAEGDAEDVNRAVAAARKAFEGPWSRFKPYERQRVLLKLADLVEHHFDELSSLDTLDMGAPISRTKATRLRVLGMLRYYAGQATSIHGEMIPNSLPGDVFSYTLKEPVGVVGAIISVERPARCVCLENRPCACHRLHGDPQAGRRSAADVAASGPTGP
ncbi:MAG TPA: aldehyde dehydrogenase family protein [Vicinamibacterales bacterium]